MKPSSLVILLVLALALGGGYWYITGQRDPKKVEVPKLSPLLAFLEADPDVLVTLNADGSKEYHLERGDKGLWRLSYPVEDEASAARVESILSGLRGADKRHFLAPDAVTPKVLEETELKSPKGSILVGSGSRRVRIEFGGETFFDGGTPRSYARIFEYEKGRKKEAAPAQIYEVPSGLEVGVTANLDEMRNGLVFHAGAASIQSFALSRRDKEDSLVRIRAVRKGTGFQLAEPLVARVDLQKAKTMLAGLLALRARRFLPLAQQPALVRGEKPWLSLSLVGSYGEEKVRIYRNQIGTLYALKDDRAVTLLIDEASFSQQFLSSAFDFVDTSLWPFDPSEASKIHVSVQGLKPAYKGLVLQSLHPEPGFKLLMPREGWADAAAVSGLLRSLSETHVLRILEGPELEKAKKALGVPKLQLRLDAPVGTNGDPLRIDLALGEKTGEAFAKKNGEALYYAVSAKGWGTLTRRWFHYAELVAFRIDRTQQPSRILIDGGDKPERSFTRNEDGDWIEKGKPEPRFEDDVYGPLCKLKASRVYAEGGAELLKGRKLLRRFRVESTKDRAGKRRLLGQLELFAADGGAALVSRKGGELIYELPKWRVERLLAW